VSERIFGTVAGVPVDVSHSDGVLTITVGRFDPASAGRLRRTHPRLTARLGLSIAGENGQTALRPGQRLLFDLYPEPPGGTGTLLLCDGCYRAATGLEEGCEDGCRKEPGHNGHCLHGWEEDCQWCGGRARLREVPRAGVERRLPAVGEADGGMWHLHFTDGAHGPFPSARDAWEYWHANGGGEAPSRSEGKPREAS
jgi:hypothetical protein